jgi:precorrin-4 methylase
MNPRLTMQNRDAYQIETGVPRRVYGARERIKREAHALVIQTTDGDTAKDKADALWVTDLRRGRLSIYGALLRFIDTLHRKGVSKEMAMQIPRWIAAYVDELWSDTPSQQVIKRDRAA